MITMNTVPIQKKPLGKGLSALLNQNTALNSVREHEAANSRAKIEISINLIEPNPFQPRKEFSDEELNELKESIAVYGVIQPIIVRKYNNRFQIIAGERRWQAAKRLSLETIPAIIKDVSDKETFEIALIENIQRQNLNALEEAQAYDKMISEYAYTHETLAKKIGKSRSHVSNILRLLLLPQSVKTLIATQKLSAGHARALVNSVNAEELAGRVIRENWSVRQTENEIKKTGNLKPSIGKVNKGQNKISEEHLSNRDEALGELENMLRKALGLSVQIDDDSNGRGQVVIRFTSLKELDFIVTRLSPGDLNF
jgi:ParB family transcriptional regulator, chromosome partitioning protein